MKSYSVTGFILVLTGFSGKQVPITSTCDRLETVITVPLLLIRICLQVISLIRERDNTIYSKSCQAEFKGHQSDTSLFHIWYWSTEWILSTAAILRTRGREDRIRLKIYLLNEWPLNRLLRSIQTTRTIIRKKKKRKGYTQWLVKRWFWFAYKILHERKRFIIIYMVRTRRYNTHSTPTYYLLWTLFNYWTIVRITTGATKKWEESSAHYKDDEDKIPATSSKAYHYNPAVDDVHDKRIFWISTIYQRTPVGCSYCWESRRRRIWSYSALLSMPY